MSQTSDEEHEHAMAKGAHAAKDRRTTRPRAEVLSELPMVTALLVAAVLVAVLAASGPVLAMIGRFNAV